VTGPEPAYDAESGADVDGMTPPGHFVSEELQSDCARFIEQVRELARTRAQALARA
jgi:hypothetical protein